MHFIPQRRLTRTLGRIQPENGSLGVVGHGEIKVISPPFWYKRCTNGVVSDAGLQLRVQLSTTM
eukprot:979712-Rhodomonas_salina.1